MFRKILLVAACLMPGVAQAEWQEARTKHFSVYSDDTPEHIRDYAVRLEKFDKAIRILHGAPEDPRAVPNRVTVFVLPDVDAVQKLHPGAAGFWEPFSNAPAFMPRSGGNNSNGLTPQVIMFHEYTHHWMLTSWSDAAFPAWFAEGMAEMHATALFRSDGSVVFGANPRYRRYGVSWSDVMPANRLLTAIPGKLQPEESAALYGRGWLLTHYLMFDPERRKLLASYIAAINAGQPPLDAAKIFGNLSVLDVKLDNYGSRPSFPSISIPASALKVGEIKIRVLPAGEAAVMPARIRSAAGVDKTSAPGALTLARKLAEPFPNDAGAQNELAEAEFDAAGLGPAADAEAGYRRAEAAADRALAGDPRSVHALLYKGRAQAALAEKAGITDAATWQGIRHWFVAANKIETENAEPLYAYYASFAAAKQAATKNAELGLLYAYALAPQDLNLRMAAGKIYLHQGKAEQARIALTPIAFNLEIGAAGDGLRKILAALDTGGTTAALAEIDAQENKTKADAAKAKDGDKSH
ncbi:MAG: hypothetical protein WC804_03875 [Sphingomonas sp.]|jgi:hypothetical protein|uniref:hypothetical protein n=1 Tax=Sphingomonas sp. TaxID=28214 RepID=UPI003562BEBB